MSFIKRSLDTKNLIKKKSFFLFGMRATGKSSLVKKQLGDSTFIIDRNTELFGQLFEQFIACELRAYLSYKRRRETLKFWHTKHGQEVDFIIGDKVAIEVKASERINDKHLKGLCQLQEENIIEKYFIVSLDVTNRKQKNINIIYWKDFLDQLWADEIF